ncbi:MAG: hypothetical protein ABIR87_06490 [Sphingomicrobium sp.]
MIWMLASAGLGAIPAMAGVSGFAIVNGVGKDIMAMSIRRVGSGQWQSLSAAPAAGKSASASFSDPDCAFDLRATLAGGAIVTWPGVNLCDVKLLTLRRNDAGLAWIDYD